MTSGNGREPDIATKLDHQLAVPMFVVALLFLIIAGFLLPTLLYREPVALESPTSAFAEQPTIDLAQAPSQPELSEEIVYFVPEIRFVLQIVLLGLYGLLVGEAGAHWLAGGKNLRQHITYLLVPFMRLSTRDHQDGSHVWVVGLGWNKSTLLLEKKLAQAFGIPMVAMALPVLPLILVQFFWSSTVSSNPNLKFLMATSTAIIWVVFVFEFVIMFSVTKRKLKYCKEHWINLLIVILPLFGFLRLAALGSIFKLNQLAKTASVLRLRGLAIRLWRGMISLGLIDKALRKTPDHKIEKLDRMIEEKLEELEVLQWERQRAIELKAKKLADLQAPSAGAVSKENSQPIAGTPGQPSARKGKTP